MNDTTTPDKEPKSRPNRCCGRGKRFGVFSVALLALGVVATIGVIGHSNAGWSGHHGWPMGHGHHSQQMGRHAQRVAERLLDKVDANDSQRQQIQQQLDMTITELEPYQGRRTDLRKQLMAQLNGAQIDRAELERLRQESLGVADEITSLLLERIATMADNLTPEQRQTLLSHYQGHH